MQACWEPRCSPRPSSMIADRVELALSAELFHVLVQSAQQIFGSIRVIPKQADRSARGVDTVIAGRFNDERSRKVFDCSQGKFVLVLSSGSLGDSHFSIAAGQVDRGGH